MHFFSGLVSAALVSLALAQQVVEDSSFGHKLPISPNSYSIPGWSILGEGHVPQMLSDKVIMTPPVGGNKRGALWAEKKNSMSVWSAEMDFRAGGQDRAGGNLQLWYVKDGSSKVSTGSIYTTGKFEGMVIVIDTVGGVQKIRGFLNDGNTDYKNHHTVESLAFGHCDYSYRNLGRPSKLTVKHSAGGLNVMIDDQACFSTPKVALPTDYGFGVTAASSDPPDSFEIYKLVVSDPGYKTFKKAPGSETQQPIARGSSQQSSASLQPQFDDLHSRIQALSKSVDSLSADIQLSRQKQEEILTLLRSSNLQGAIDSKLNNMDKLVGEIHREVKSTDHNQNYEKLSQQLQKTHEGITEHVPSRLREYVQSHTPRIGFIAFSFMAFQSCCLAVLLWQKWRKSNMPKKFL